MFDQPEYVSAGLQKDVLRVTILDSDAFKSKETSETLQFGMSTDIKIPKIMRDDALTDALVGTSSSV